MEPAGCLAATAPVVGTILGRVCYASIGGNDGKTAALAPPVTPLDSGWRPTRWWGRIYAETTLTDLDSHFLADHTALSR